MRRFFILVLNLLAFGAFSQSSSQFRMPSGLSPADYSSVYVLAKLNPSGRDLVQSTPGGRVATAIPGIQSARHLIDETVLFKGRTSQGPRIAQPSIDISSYYEVTCPAGSSIEDFINQLYQTGYFELVEPAYVHKIFFTPNDASLSQQYYLTNINAFGGWDIHQGSEAVTIAIVDTGGDLDHPDLRDNIYSNPNDPQDGVNNDNDIYLDDYQGWDFVGADTLNAFNPNFVGDNDPGLAFGGNLAHGVSVAGCASGRANNGVGIAGVGFKSKLMITKHTADNQNPNRVTVIRGYSGILYAASKGAKIINCSWGGKTRSQIEQDLINYVTNDLGSLVVAAAGNDGSSSPLYPAAYDNVLSVAATTKTNAWVGFSNFGTTIDISAPGVDIYTTTFNNAYTTLNGTSFASPLVAGAAALVLAKNPTFTPQQISEQLRVTANATDFYAKNASMLNQLGRGLLDVQQALSLESPSLRASSPKLVNASGLVVEPGQKGFLTFSIKNLLKSTSAGLEVSITSNSGFVKVTKAKINPGIIGANAVFNNSLTPFEMDINPNTSVNTVVSLLISYTDGIYKDFQYLDFILNPSFIDINTNRIGTTLASIGRIGYEDTESSRIKGSGFVFEQNPMLFEMGLIMGTSQTDMYNNVRKTATGGYDQDFVSLNKIKQISPGDRSTSEIFGSFSNSSNVASQAVVVNYRSMVWQESPYDKFVIVEYKIQNPTALQINNFHFGIFADWDITTNGAQDAAQWDAINKMGYVYPAVASAKPYAGIQLLTGTPEYYAIDNDHRINGNPLGIYDGFSDAEKYTAISSGMGKLQAGIASGTGNDVSHVVSTGPYAIPAGQEIKIAFALHAALNFSDLQTSARYADSVYNFTLPATKPVLANVDVCYNAPATLNASGAPKYKWYKSFTGGVSFLTGSQFVTPNLLGDTTYYVSNADKTYESVRTPVKVTVKANPKISTSGSPTFCAGESITLSVADADSYLWSTTETTKSITINSPGSYSVTVTHAALGCQSVSPQLPVVVNPVPSSVFSISTAGELKNNMPISFSNQSTGAISSLWDFGDGQTSQSASPSHAYATGSNYTVKLTVYSDKGCQNISTKSVAVITGIESGLTNEELTVFPNPSRSGFRISVKNESLGVVSVRLVTMMGHVVHEAEGGSEQRVADFEIPAAGLSEGLYLVLVKVDNRLITQKVIKIQ